MSFVNTGQLKILQEEKRTNLISEMMTQLYCTYCTVLYVFTLRRRKVLLNTGSQGL